MIHYYSPNFGVFDFFKSLFTRRWQDKTVEYFRSLTGKKYILLTSSCRVALYLAYEAINSKGSVITSPLTCKSAIDPILWSSNQPVFTDIDPQTLNMNTAQISSLVEDDTVAVQVIHHGGLMVDTAPIVKVVANKDVFIIEDCAQSFGATFNQTKPVYRGDVVCFSLIKNAYGIGGGILATDSEEIYNRAKEIQGGFIKFPSLVVNYRIAVNILETYQNLFVCRYLLKTLKGLRRNRLTIENESEDIQKYKYKPAPMFFKVFASRIKKMERLQQKRKERGSLLFDNVLLAGLAENYKDINLKDSSFTKLFVFHPKLKSQEAINRLRSEGIDAKHLEQRDDGRVQRRFDNCSELVNSFQLNEYPVYFKVHDSLVSLPLTEKVKEEKINRIIEVLDNSSFTQN